jgi:hypothetical protein
VPHYPKVVANVPKRETLKSPYLGQIRSETYLPWVIFVTLITERGSGCFFSIEKRKTGHPAVAGNYRGVIVGELAVDGEVKKPYQAPQLKEYGDLGSLTLGNVGTKMDNTGMGVFATKA